MEAAFPSDPVWLSGISEVLDTGMKLSFYETEKKAKENSQEKEVIVKDIEVEEQADSAEKPDYDTALLAELLVDEKEEDDKKKLNVIIRTDTQGTVDAVESELAKLNDADVEVTIVDKGTGQITEGDIYKAKTVKAIVLGFRVDYPKDVEAIAKREKVLVRRYEIIYEMVEEVDAALTGLLEPEQEEVEVARAKVKQVFELTNGDVVAGCEVIKGRVLRGYRVYVDREGERVADGKITSLKRNKDEVKEVDKGLDCGILIEPKAVIEVGDEIVAYKVERV
jgi:translation initiation factor IF-2